MNFGVNIMLTDINEDVEVIAFFGKNRTIPYIVRWGGRQFKVQKINLTHQTWEGQTKLFFFNATCEGASLKLRFNTAGLSWHLEQIWTE